jgi:hypothetical protein
MLVILRKLKSTLDCYKYPLTPPINLDVLIDAVWNVFWSQDSA